MPRKILAAKQRRDWRLADLGIADLLALRCGWSAGDSYETLGSLEDCRQCYEQNAAAFDVLCLGGDGCDHEMLCHLPGRRPWAWWLFQAGRKEIPRDQVKVLRQLGELTAEEERLLRAGPRRRGGAGDAA